MPLRRRRRRMLTIRIINKDCEIVTEVKNVMLIRETDVTYPYLRYWSKDDEKDGEAVYTSIFEGDVFVMNENGNTIAAYHLTQRPTGKE
jgi:hypothetical protein